MNNEIKFAPVLITTLCRSTHFIKSLESLKRNTWAQYTDVYIAIDYPCKESHRSGYNEICEYLETSDFSVFKNIYVIKRTHNYGASENMMSLISQAMQKYDRWIIAEDDIFFSPVFLEYMNTCLCEFENDPQVLAINGYAYPIQYATDYHATVIKQSCTFSAWGVGYWTEKIKPVMERLSQRYLFNHFDTAVKEGALTQMIKGRYYDYLDYALTAYNEKIYTQLTDIAQGIYMSLNNIQVITPVLSKTRNLGFDGSGLYCPNILNFDNHNSLSYDYASQPIDMSSEFKLVVDTGMQKETNRKLLDSFIFVTRKQKIRGMILMTCYRTFGRSFSIGLFNGVKRIKKVFVKK